MYCSTTNFAWINLKEMPPHKHRQADIAFNGRTFVKIEHDTNARGLSELLTSFLTNNKQEHPREFYIPHQSHLLQIDPQHFIDCRDPEVIEDDYFRVGLPGDPPNTDYLRPIRVPPHNIPNLPRSQILEYNYTNWSNGDTTSKHALKISERCLDIAYSIVYYWHISMGRPPKSNGEAFGALINAIGLGYLRHPILPSVHKSAEGAQVL